MLFSIFGIMAFWRWHRMNFALQKIPFVQEAVLFALVFFVVVGLHAYFSFQPTELGYGVCALVSHLDSQQCSIWNFNLYQMVGNCCFWSIIRLYFFFSPFVAWTPAMYRNATFRMIMTQNVFVFYFHICYTACWPKNETIESTFIKTNLNILFLNVKFCPFIFTSFENFAKCFAFEFQIQKILSRLFVHLLKQYFLLVISVLVPPHTFLLHSMSLMHKTTDLNSVCWCVSIKMLLNWIL